MKRKFGEYFYIYRYDLFAIALMGLAILYYASILFQPGHVVFSDIDFPFYSKDYMDEIFGLWNTRWNTVSMLNIPRLFFIMPLYLISGIFGWNGHLMLKGFILELMFLSAFSMYLLSKRLVSVYMGRAFNLWKINALIFGSVLYALNPWMIYRIQHIYLLTGYSLFPLVILYFFKVFDHKFQSQFIPQYSPYTSKLYARNVLDILILAFLITVSSAAIHYFFYSVLVLGILYVLICTKYLIGYASKGKVILKNIFISIMKKTVILAIIMVGLSFYWLSIYVGGIVFDVGASQHNINVIDTYTMFSRHASLGQVVLMMGYWWPMIDVNAIPIWFYIGGAGLVAVVLLGAIKNAYKHHILLFLTLLALGLTLISTGVYYPALSGLFLKMANLPAFGNIFRDPNKMIGLTAVSYSVLFVFGLENIYTWALRRKHAQPLCMMVFALSVLVFYAYLFPVRNIYFEKYFQPVEEPEAYVELREYYKNQIAGPENEEEDPYALYIPVAEQMLRPVVHIATPRWNVSDGFDDFKATGDIHIYNSPVDTVFHHEGNDPSIKYMYDLIQLLLDQGRTTHIEDLVKTFGINQLIYHNEYLDQELRQAFNESILSMQDGLGTVYENGIFKVMDVDFERTDNTFNHRRIFTPFGLQKLNSFMELEGFNPLETPLVFMAKEENFNRSVIEESDIIEYQTVNDLVLTGMSSEYKLYPFDFVDEVNPFIKWSKTYTTFADWAWFQHKLDVIHPQFDWDNDRGMVLTFASEAFDVKPHEKKLLEGEVVYDFDSLLKADSFFTADNPDLFEVFSNPYNLTENVGVLHGVIQRGEPSHIWQVAKSPVLVADEKMPYQFKILVSGRGANKLHMKARFYDKNKKEIGIQYIVGPDEFVDFDTIQFTGEVVSPKDTAFLRIDLLTYQRPENKIYWWIHDVEIQKFPKYTKPNSIDMEKAVGKGKHRIFVKHFASEAGGILQVSVDGKRVDIDTRTNQLNGFRWAELGSFDMESEKAKISMTNISGFNAIQHIVIIPEDMYNLELNEWEKVLKNTDRLLKLEAEMDLEKIGNIQSRRLYPQLSYGTGVSLSRGALSADFEVAEPGYYDVIPSVYFHDELAGSFTIKIVDENETTIYQKDLSQREAFKMEDTGIVDFDPLSEVYPYSILEIKSPFRYKNSLNLDGIPLMKGRYRIILEVESENQNYADLSTFHTFDPSTIITETARIDETSIDCSTCERIYPYMMRHTYDIHSGLVIDFDPTCSCDWYISSSEKIEVDAYEELLVSFKARSDAIVKRHSKFIFLDEYDQVLDTAFVFEVEEQEKTKWNAYEQLVKVPNGAKKVLYQFWARGHKTRPGKLEIKDLKLEKYKELVLVDSVVLKSSELDLSERDLTPDIEKNHRGEMLFEHEVVGSSNEKTVWNSFMSPHKIWRVNGEKSQLTLNGVTMGFYPQDGKLKGLMTLSSVYTYGLVLHFITLLISYGLYAYMRKREERS